MMSRKSILQNIFIGLIFVCFIASATFAQTTAFTYQGRLTNAGTSPTANYDFEFRLFDASGSVIAGQQVLNVPVTNGVFNTSLDFGAGAFSGANRFLEIAVRPAGGGAFTILLPRQQILSAPYAVKSLTATTADNSMQLGGVNSSRFVQTDAGGNVSIGGNLTVAGAVTYDTVNATTQFNLGGQRVLKADDTNLFAGRGAGINNTGLFNTFVGANAGRNNMNGCCNSFFGDNAGASNTIGERNIFVGGSAGVLNLNGSRNTFVGERAGNDNVAGNDNAFFGFRAGFKNTASNNAFFGAGAGKENTTGGLNAFFGINAGMNNVAGCCNSFFGNNAGWRNTDGRSNSFFGGTTGGANTTGSYNSFFGDFTGISLAAGDGNTFVGANTAQSVTAGSYNTVLGNNITLANNLTNATALGANAFVSTSNSMVLGSINGVNEAPASTNVGIGTPSPVARLNVVGTTWFQGNTTPLSASAGKGVAAGFQGEAGYLFAYDYSANTAKNLILNNPGGNVGIGTTLPLHRLGIAGGPVWTSNGWTGAVEMANGSAIGWRANSGSKFGIGQSGNLLAFFRTASNPGDTVNPAVYDLAIDDIGNIGIGTLAPRAKLDVVGDAVQDRTSNGLVKAMAFVNASNTIVRCYNSTLTGSAATTPPCGFQFFTVSGRQIDFGFKVDDRFVSVTANQGAGSTASFILVSNNQNSLFVYTSPSNAPFMIIVY